MDWWAHRSVVLLSKALAIAEKYNSNIDTNMRIGALVQTAKTKRARHMNDRKIDLPIENKCV